MPEALTLAAIAHHALSVRASDLIGRSQGSLEGTARIGRSKRSSPQIGGAHVAFPVGPIKTPLRPKKSPRTGVPMRGRRRKVWAGIEPTPAEELRGEVVLTVPRHHALPSMAGPLPAVASLRTQADSERYAIRGEACWPAGKRSITSLVLTVRPVPDAPCARSRGRRARAMTSARPSPPWCEPRDDPSRRQSPAFPKARSA